MMLPALPPDMLKLMAVEPLAIVLVMPDAAAPVTFTADVPLLVKLVTVEVSQTVAVAVDETAILPVPQYNVL